MRFYGEPNLLVKEYDKGALKYKPLFRFNQEGFFETENSKLVKRLMLKFPTEKTTQKEKKQEFKVTDTVTEPKENEIKEPQELNPADQINLSDLDKLPRKELLKKLDEEIETNEYQVTDSSIKKLYACKYCNRKFDNAGVWMTHIKKYHKKGVTINELGECN